MEKVNKSGLDIKQLNIERIKEIFPNCVSDGRINFDVLKEILGDEIDESKEKYQFTWSGKSQAIKNAQTPSTATLRPCKEKSEHWQSTQNIYIEGDNLEVLKQLQKTYFGKIKMIYIDPPYNTGNDFVYKDNFSDSLENYKKQTNQALSSNPETSGRYHTDWLNMMYPRLTLAKNLLKKDGVIFISIDDNELDNLKKICGEIFGERAFVGIFIWEKTFRPSNFTKTTRKNTEYIICYAKGDIELQGVYEDSQGDFSLTKKLHNEHILTLPANYVNANFGDGTYKKGDYKNGYELLDDIEVKNGKVINTFKIKVGMSIWSQEHLNEEISKGVYLVFKNSETMVLSARKTYQKSEIKPTTLLDNENVGDVLEANKEINQLFGTNVFDYPKPTSLITNLMSFIKDFKNETILDFFSGSATTAHAVLLSNMQNANNNRFILIQLPEKCSEDSEAYKAGFTNICDIGEERIRKAATKILEESNKKNSDIGLFDNQDEVPSLDLGFKVFKLDSTNIKPWDNTTIQNENNLLDYNEIFKEDRTKEDVLYEIMLKYGIFDQQATPEVINGKEMFKVGSRYMVVCLEDNITAEDVKKIGELKPRVVVFKENGFANDNDKINATYNLEKAGVEDIRCI